MADHIWVNENLDTYLAGDLTTAEREGVEQHVAACESCTQALADARRLERLMNGLFTDARPAANLDERIIQALAPAPTRTRERLPRAWRIIVGAAAVLVVGLVGYIAQAMSEVRVEQTAFVVKKEAPWRFIPVGQSDAANAYVAALEQELKAGGNDLAGTNRKMQEMDVLTDGDVKNRTFTGYTKAGTLTPDLNIPLLDNPRSLGPKASAGPKGILGNSQPSLPQKPSLEPLQQNYYARVPGADEFKLLLKNKFYDQDEMKETAKANKPGDGQVANMDPSKQRVQFAPVFESPTTNWAMPNTQAKGPGMPPAGAFPTYADGAMGKGFGGGAGMMGGGGVGVSGRWYDARFNVAPPGPAVTGNSALPGTTLGYFVQPAESPSKSLSQPLAEKAAEPKIVTEQGTKQPDKKPQPEPPLETNRKIIRTGEMEFEIDSFDKSVETITRIITAIKGGFVSTINSDKLANGKMRGSIVVRMPPQYLDQFVLELRRELAKSGDLKNQRIISLDVTKQYTDIESRLRAARAIEERLINIIKTGKGEIKDLVAAEKELGVWRTKIEEMEGEIRYYANQVALSTLTITLNEKEILAPTAIVITERVTMRLEVEDVAKAHQMAMSAVEEVKGRITKSELKQHSAGQLQSILHADIPPAKKDAFRDKLKKLGILSDHQENQQQHTEGGVGKGPELKPRQDDVRFEVTMHNTANVRPRLTADLKLATSDVPAAYAKLLDEIARLKGQVRDGKLNEQDKLNVTAFLDFNVPTAEKPALDKLLLDLGPVLERVNVLAPVNELSTTQKFGYTLHLRDFTSIAPSKSIVEIIAVTDVPAEFARLQEVVAKAKGQVVQANLNEADKLNIFAQFDFTVLAEEKPALDKLLAELGTSLSRTKFQTPLNQLSTARKFGYSIALRDFIGVPPAKATELKIATTDVPTNYARIVDAIAKAKGRVSDGKLNEQDKLHITAHLAFTVPSEEKAAFDKLLGEVGTVLSRNNVQAPVNQLVTAKKFGYAIDLRDFTTIKPTQASVLTIAASKVPENFARLIDAVGKAKGQVESAKLDEKDRLNVTGQITFTVPSDQKASIEKLLADMGTTLSRKNEQAPANELSTDGKFGYAVELRDFASIPAREIFLVQLAITDVPASFREFQDAIGLSKGWVKVGQLDEENKAKTEAVIDFDVPSAERPAIEKLLAKAGAVLSRTARQAGVNDLATDQKVGYRVRLSSATSIPPREKTLIKFEVADVKGKSEELKQLVLAGQGRIIDSTFDRFENGQATAVLVFEVPFAAQGALIRQMGEPASQRTARNAQIPENALTTAQIVVTLSGGDPIVPNDKGISSYVHTSLNLSFKILATIVMTLIVGLSALLPIAIILWLGFKMFVVMFGGAKPMTESQPTTETDRPADTDSATKQS